MGSLTLAVLLLASTRAVADAGEGREAAREHFRKGTTQYTLNHYEEAILEFEAGYAAEAEPAFLYNLAQAHARLGHLKVAIDFYKKYLELGATAEDTGQVREMIDQLNHELEAKAPPPVVAPPPKPLPAIDVTAPPPPPPKRTWVIGVGVAVAVVVIAAVIGLSVGLTRDQEPAALWSLH